MKITIVIIFILKLSVLQSQELIFPIYFEDSRGNKDSIIMGIDEIATNGIDTFLDEENILSLPIIKPLDVRITNELCVFFSPDENLYQTKKQILNNPEGKILNIQIRSENHPLKASWNSTILRNHRIRGALMTDTKPGGWFDVIGHGDLGFKFMGTQDSVVFTPYIYSDETDTISNYWFEFGWERIVSVKDITLGEKIIVFPNPSKGKVRVQNQNNEKIIEMELFNILGQSIMRTRELELDLKELNNGIYKLIIRFDSEELVSKTIMKNSKR